MNEPNELDWLAFQYIADELSPTEASAFERRLADEQEAREAVARAVELSQAAAAALDMQPVGCAETVQPSARNFFWTGALWWMSCGAAACLAIVVGYQTWTSMNPAKPAMAPPSAALAEAWSVARQQLATTPELPVEPYRPLEIADSADDHVDPMATPSWLVAALNPDADPADEGSAMEEEMMDSTPGTKGEG